MTSPDYKCDVAFSLLSKDHNLAQQLADHLSEHLSVFLYSERQEDLAGTDGLKTFHNVFRHEARVVVVLYRPGWGEATWTQVEEKAIQDRLLREGWEFLLVIALDPPNKPVWLPDIYLWRQLGEHGVDCAVTLIEAHVTRMGGRSGGNRRWTEPNGFSAWR